ncbi:hypothetical protein [Chryseobacterium balustinum]|uniref:hypothetical protein n=1 Tax=Chryseobacterium balustinum TaxID=246 RepID=UPI003CFB7FA1
MVNKIWNSILMILTLGLIVGIVYNETSYGRFSRFDYYLNVNYNNDVNVWMVENEFYTKDKSISIPKGENNYSFKKEFVPEKMHLVWFNFVDDKFYEFKGDLPYELIREKITTENEISLKLGKHDTFQLIVNGEILQSFIAKEVSKQWFNENISREKMVFFSRDKIKIKSYLNLESDSEFSKISFSPVTFYNPSYRSSDYADSLVNGRFFYENKPLETNLIEQINLSLIKKNYAIKGSADYLKKTTLKLKIDFDFEQLYEIFKSNPKNKFDLNIIVDKNDSLKSIYFIDQNKMIKLDVRTRYEEESKIDTDKIK